MSAGHRDRFAVAEADCVLVAPASVRAATTALFRKVGLGEADAALAADVLVHNDLRGMASHGVSNQLRHYLRGYQQGRYHPTPEVRIVRETAGTALVDGGGGLGVVVAPRCMQIAMDKARANGVAAVSVRNVGHLGGCGYHAMLALSRDMIGLAMTSKPDPCVLPTFGAVPRLGTNPLAYAIPALELPSLVLDMSTSQISANKLTLARRQEIALAPGWIASSDGTPIMEEALLPDRFHLLPLGGTRDNGSHKGYGLGLVVHALTTILGGATLAASPSASLHLVVHDVAAFTEVAEFKGEMDRMLRELLATPSAPGAPPVTYPGHQAAARAAHRAAHGIPYHRQVIEWFRLVEAEFHLDFDFTYPEPGSGRSVARSP